MRAMLAALAVLLLTFGAAYADDTGADAVSLLGCKQTLSGAALRVTCDEGEVISKLPDLQAMGAVNPELSVAFLNTHHVALTGVVLMTAVVAVLKIQYDGNKSLDAIKVEGDIAAADDYGNTSPKPAFTFGFDRATYQRVNWQTFQPANLAKIGKRFVYSPWYQQAMAAEFM